ncbi:Alpha/Beta hydrolase protein [Pestalotiopsis sp. NC0098]|nr:Alpha/Beta hydrolase protein [Pestalotiopsis sp. NC0098]
MDLGDQQKPSSLLSLDCPTLTESYLSTFPALGKVHRRPNGPASRAMSVTCTMSYVNSAASPAIRWEPESQPTMMQTKANEAQVVLVGHSLGTAIALHFAAQYPSTVAGLVLIGATRSASHIPAARERMLNMANSTRENGIKWAADLASKSNFASPDKRQVDDSLRAEVAKAVEGSDPEAYALTCEMMVDEAHKDPNYAKISCPTVLITGDMDVISPIERSTGLAKLIGSKTCCVEAVMSGHQPILEDLDGVAGAVGRLLRELQ